MTNPSDPWAPRPDSPDTPTERLGGPGPESEQPAHTTEYSEAYGQSPDPYHSTQPYGHPGPYEQTAPYEFPSHPQYFDQDPGPNATRELPPYDSQWGAYESPYGESGGYPPYGSGNASGPQQPLGPTGLPVEPPRRRRTGLWIGLTAAVFVLVVLGGIAAGLLLAGNSSTSSDEAAPSRPAPTRMPVVPPNSGNGTQPSLPQLPGLGDIDGLGATMGTVTTNDGSTVVIQSLLGSSVTVHTDGNTQVISVGSGKVSDLKQGDMVVVQGDKASDGSITAKIIISTQLPR